MTTISVPLSTFTRQVAQEFANPGDTLLTNFNLDTSPGPGFSDTGGVRPERGVQGQADPTSSGLGLGIVEDILAEYGTGAEIDGNGRCRISFEIPLCREIPLPVDKPGRKRERQAPVSS